MSLFVLMFCSYVILFSKSAISKLSNLSNFQYSIPTADILPNWCFLLDTSRSQDTIQNIHNEREAIELHNISDLSFYLCNLVSV